MADDVKIRIKVEGDTKQYDKAIGKSEKATKKFGKTGASAFSGLINPITLSAVAIASVGLALKGVIGEASKFEDIAVQFEVLTGSASESKRVIAELQTFAASTPFQFEGIAQATKQLLGFGFSTEEALGHMQSLGDVAAALGVPLTDLSLIFGQVQAAGKLTGERLLQLQERAVPIGAALAETLGVAETAVKDLVSRGKVDFATFETAFRSIAEEGGIAFGGMQKKSETLSGKISTLKDNISILAASTGSLLLPALKSVTGKLTEFVQGIQFLAATDAKTQLLKTRVAIDDVDESLRQLNQAIIDRENGPSISSIIFGKTKNELGVEVDAFKKEKDRLLKEQDDLLAVVNAGNEKSDAESEARRAKFLAKKEEEKQAKIASEQELKAALLQLDVDHAENISNLSDEQLAVELEAITKKEESLAEAKLETRALELEAKGQHEEALALVDEAATKKKAGELKQRQKDRKSDFDKQKKLDDQRLKLDQLTAQAQVNIASATANLIVAVAGRGNKLAFLISKGAAIAQAVVATNLASVQALAVPPSPNFALAGLAKTAGAINIAAIAATAIQGFAQGGEVGGRSGGDVNPALLARGEIVAPAQNFDEVIGSVRALRIAEELRDEGDGGGNGLVEVIVGFTDDAFEIIEQKQLERRAIGSGGI